MTSKVKKFFEWMKDNNYVLPTPEHYEVYCLSKGSNESLNDEERDFVEKYLKILLTEMLLKSKNNDVAKMLLDKLFNYKNNEFVIKNIKEKIIFTTNDLGFRNNEIISGQNEEELQKKLIQIRGVN